MSEKYWKSAIKTEILFSGQKDFEEERLWASKARWLGESVIMMHEDNNLAYLWYVGD